MGIEDPHGDLMFQTSNEAMEPYSFKINNLCVNAGFNEDG